MKNNRYDVIVIGSGIGGLVAAVYLAKAGKKVLVLEKNKEPGGYCTSFYKKGFIIDTAIHAIQNCERGSVLNRIFIDTDIINKLKLRRANPTDTILTDDFKIHIMNDPAVALEQFAKIFPEERKALINFFALIIKRDLSYIFSKYRNKTLRFVLDEYFSNSKLKTIFGVFLSNIGSLPENTSMLTAYALLKQFIISGGYYPSGGMQTIPNALVSSLEAFGGEILYKHYVEKIAVDNGKVEGVVVRNNDIYYAPIIISNSDMAHTFKNMLDVGMPELLGKIEEYRPSLSIFIVYILLKKCFRSEIDFGPGVWYVPSEKTIAAKINNDEYVMANRAIFCSFASKLDDFLSPPDHDYLRIMINTEYKSQHFWVTKYKELTEKLIDQVSKFIPNLREEIMCIGHATPWTMSSYTLNSGGAVCGWWNSPVQVNNPVANYFPKIKGLYFSGHWVTQLYGNGGVAMAADSGRKAAKLIIEDETISKR